MGFNVIEVDLLSQSASRISSNIVSLGAKLPRKVGRPINNITERMRGFIMRSARKRAPRWSGRLSSSIKKGLNDQISETKGIFSILVDAPYAAQQELGFSPHFIGAGYSTKTGRGGHLIVKDYMQRVGLFGGEIEVRRNTPFVQPAILKGRQVFAKKYPKEIAKAIQAAWGNMR